MDFVEPRSQPRWLNALRAALPVLLGLVFAAVYLTNLAPEPTPDGQAYLDLVRVGDPFHAQHLLYGVPLYFALQAFPQHNAVQVAGAVAALFGAFGVGSFAFMLQRLRIPTPGVLTGSVILGVGAGWMAQSTAWEVHVGALATVFLACGLALGPARRPWGVAAVMALGILLHKTMILALPAVFLLAIWGREDKGRRLLGMIGLTALAGLLAYGGVGLQAVKRGKEPRDVAVELVLGELRMEEARPVVQAPLVSARDTFAKPLLRVDQGQNSATSLAMILGILGLAVAGTVQMVRAGERRELLLLLWPGLALPAAVAFEAYNFEYYMGPVAVLMGVGMGALRGRWSWALLPLAVGVGLWNHADLGLDGDRSERDHTPRGRERQGPARNPSDG